MSVYTHLFLKGNRKKSLQISLEAFFYITGGVKMDWEELRQELEFNSIRVEVDRKQPNLGYGYYAYPVYAMDLIWLGFQVRDLFNTKGITWLFAGKRFERGIPSQFRCGIPKGIKLTGNTAKVKGGIKC